MESIGAQFSEAREARGATLSEAASATRIKIQHLEAMERDDFSNMAAAAYARGFIKIYAEYLDIPVEPLIQLYSRHHTPHALRQGLSTNDIPAALPAGGDADLPAKKVGASWSELIADVGLIKRIALPVAAIVVGVLLVAVMAKLLGGNPSDDPSPAGKPEADIEILRVADPPASYLERSLPSENQP